MILVAAGRAGFCLIGPETCTIAPMLDPGSRGGN